MTTIATFPVSSLRTTPARSTAPAAPQRWRVEEIEALYNLPFMDLLFRAQQVHRENFNPNEVQLSTLLSIKTGGCAAAPRTAVTARNPPRPTPVSRPAS